ncbi:MAG: 3-phosphoshikimate 1-carboxyvinyltransferase [Acidimicrobiales bacterium]
MGTRVGRLLVKEMAQPLLGEFAVPCSKYHAHRALMLAALVPGTSRIRDLSGAKHIAYTVQALRRLGTTIETDGNSFVVSGGEFHPSRPEVPIGSSGTTLYFLTGLASLASSPVTVTGQKYFRRRPVRPLLEALGGLGVRLRSDNGCPPIAVEPRRPSGGEVSIAGTLSQWVSGLLLLAPFATGPSAVNIVGPLNERSYIDLTISVMASFGLQVSEVERDRRFEVEGGQVPHPVDLTLPPDVGAAAFGLAATALHPSDVLFRGLAGTSGKETDHPEAELLDLVGEMGLPMERDPGTGWVRVRHDGLDLSPVDVDCRSVPDMLPVLSVLGSFAKGTTVLDNVAHVRLKESDRVAAMLQLNRMGGDLEVRGDRLVCHGVGHLKGADLSSFNDHRVLMALAIAGSRAEGESRLTYPNAYRISYPRFLEEMNGVGMSMSLEPATGMPAASQAAPPHRPAPPLLPGEARRTSVVGLVRRWARERPAAPAVIDVGLGGEGERLCSWQQLDEQSDALAELLADLGVGAGEAVAVQLPNVAEFVVSTLAALKVSALCCPVMPNFREREVAFMLRRARARVLVVPDRFRRRDYPGEVAGMLAGAAGGTPALEHVIVVGDGALPTGPRPEWHRFAEAATRPVRDRRALAARSASPTALAQLLFTSGTSGEPKGVLHRMDVLTRAAAMEVRHLGLSEADRIFVPSPLAHQTGFLYGMWLAFVLGAPQILQPVWAPGVALGLLRRWEGTFTQAATPFLADLTAAVQSSGERPESLRIFVATGATVPRDLAERATRALGAAVCGAWGTTETCLGSLSAPADEPAKVWGTDGRALRGVRLRVTDDAGNVLAPGQEGNFEVKGACGFEGYLGHPEWTAEAMTPDGWYRSGDLAVIDESGYVRISGRVKDVVNRGGEKVPVAEVEQLLFRHPAVSDVAVVAMPDARLGERACAFVVAPGGFDFAQMVAYLEQSRMTKSYWPERLELVKELPRTASGKVQKFLLREQARRLVAAELGERPRGAASRGRR